MSETVLIAAIGFFSLVVSAMTGVMGYLKIKSMSGVEVNGKQQTLQSWVDDLEERCSMLELEVQECEHHRKKLLSQNSELLSESRDAHMLQSYGERLAAIEQHLVERKKIVDEIAKAIKNLVGKK